MKRKIVKIDRDQCNGCGLCVPACAEGAIQIIDGKAKLASEVYCDGLGACLGECPEGALTIEEREVEAFDAAAVEKHLKKGPRKVEEKHAHSPAPDLPCGCPGSSAQNLKRPGRPDRETSPAKREAVPSELGNWPVQISLVPVQAPYLQGAKLLISADCAPFAYADFHRRLIKDKVVLIGCPKLDDAGLSQEKLKEIFRHNAIKEVEVVYMEVPCCFGLARLAQNALAESGKKIPLKLTKVAIRGEICETKEIDACGMEARR